MTRIRIQDDFDLQKIADSGQCFRCRKTGPNSWMFPYRAQSVEIQALGGEQFDVSCSAETWQTVWHPYFDLDRNYSAFRRASAGRSAYLDHALKTGAGLRILRQDPWETLITFILSQRRSIPVIRRCVETLCERFGVPGPGGPVFPDPHALADAGEEKLRACSLGYRALYVLKTAKQVSDGTFCLSFPESLPTTVLSEELMKLPGVGIKVASCVALFAYGRMDAAPVDTWIARVIREDFAGKTPFADFPEQAGIIQQYLFFTKRKDEKTASGKP